MKGRGTSDRYKQWISYTQKAQSYFNPLYDTNNSTSSLSEPEGARMTPTTTHHEVTAEQVRYRENWWLSG